MLLANGCSSEPDITPAKHHADSPQKHLALTFNGGPRGGTFNYFANKMSAVMSKHVHWLEMFPRESGGSLDNICALNTQTADMAILYAGDAFLARHNKLTCKYTDLNRVRAIAFLYSAPAQLVVRKNGTIRNVQDLKGRIVAIGNVGSGAALSAERFFKHLNLWDSIDHRNLGYSQAATSFLEGKIDAFWTLVGYPNTSIIEAASQEDIAFINLHQPAQDSGFYDVYPFYTSAIIPNGVYEDQTAPISTFQDSALWCTRKGIDDDAIYSSLRLIFGGKGLDIMLKAHKAAQEMSLENGLKSISIPLHPGAVRFWTENNIEIPPILLQ
ncbi:C4-dicarboxylate ABC transporter substrate-binding protein [Pseudodesulfovibrio sediminis]|uniref:C4-dicarboxylate ABC transporter substrate-binding protein n=1 Tax=Pseudodesulfovibrio sediminis TaxID=2810563 RepID=A0ABN6EU76_9BACT|nr:C4-dicarboxylate ABC transporter substrate-binding protein [Pseudodesulfovibrio sediminis]